MEQSQYRVHQSDGGWYLPRGVCEEIRQACDRFWEARGGDPVKRWGRAASEPQSEEDESENG